MQAKDHLERDQGWKLALVAETRPFLRLLSTACAVAATVKKSNLRLVREGS